MNQLTIRPKEKSVTVVKSPYVPGKSILDYTPQELNQIDAWQNQNRGFMDDDKYSRLSSWR